MNDHLLTPAEIASQMLTEEEGWEKMGQFTDIGELYSALKQSYQQTYKLASAIQKTLGAQTDGSIPANAWTTMKKSADQVVTNFHQMVTQVNLLKPDQAVKHHTLPPIPGAKPPPIPQQGAQTQGQAKPPLTPGQTKPNTAAQKRPNTLLSKLADIRQQMTKRGVAGQAPKGTPGVWTGMKRKEQREAAEAGQQKDPATLAAQSGNDLSSQIDELERGLPPLRTKRGNTPYAQHMNK